MGVVLLAAVSFGAHLYVQNQVYHPVVRLQLPDGLSIVAVLPDTNGRRACGEAKDQFVAPFQQTCKDCRVLEGRCERELDGLELAMHGGAPVPHPMVVARDLRMVVIGPPEPAKAGCQVLAANMVANGVKTALCVPPTAPKS